MHNKVLLFLILFLTSITINAQVKREKIEYEDDKVTSLSNELKTNSDELTGRFFMNFALGGNFGLGGGNAYALNGNMISNSNVSYSNGIDFQLGLGYHFNEFISGEVNINYQFGIPTDIESKYSDTVNGTYSNIVQTNSYSSNGYKINPQIVLSYPTDNVIPYVKFGPVISFCKRFERNNYNVYNSGDFDYTYEDVNSSGLGFSSCLGIKKKLNNTNKYIFFEMNHITLTQSYEKGSMISATFNGNDILSSYDTSDREYTYVSSLDANYKVTNPNLPSKRLLEYFNFNSWGLKIGLIYMLN